MRADKNGGYVQTFHPDAMINDAVHGVMSFPDKYKDLFKSLIDSETFQRLRHIKQLGMVDLIFPTAVHNRFSHCLGAAYIAHKMSDKLELKDTEEDNEKKYAVVGALLHDIGHGPFSHAFEKLLQRKNEKKEEEKEEKIKHEDWTESFLKEFETTLDNNGINYKTLSKIIRKKYDMSGKYNIAADIVSAQLDADRLDYLLRDAHFCGVPYGNPDIEWIINHLIKVKETGKPPRLGFLRKGWRSIEHFLLCRRIMTQNVYHHHKKNVFEKLLIEFLKAISEDSENKDKKLFNQVTNQRLKKFLENASSYRNEKVSKEDFIKENFSYYKTLTDYDIWMLIRDFAMDSNAEFDAANQIARRIYQRKIHRSFVFEETCLGAVCSIVENIKKDNFQDWQIFVTENDTTSYETQDDPILIVHETQGVHRIQKYSYLLNTLGDKHEKEAYLAIDLALWENQKLKKHLKDKLKKYISFPE